MRQSPFNLILALLSLAVLSAGCALLGSGETTLLRAKTFSVTPPAGWVPLEKAETDKAFRLPSGSVATLTSSCERNPEAPLESLTRHLLIGMRQVEFSYRDPFTADGTTGQYSKVSATVDKQPIQLQIFVMSKNRCIFDFVLMNPRGFTEREEAEFKQLIQSFQFEKKS